MNGGVRWLYDNVTIERHAAGNVYAKATLVAATHGAQPFERFVLTVSVQMRDVTATEEARNRMDDRIEEVVGVRPEFVKDMRVEEKRTREGGAE